MKIPPGCSGRHNHTGPCASFGYPWLVEYPDGTFIEHVCARHVGSCLDPHCLWPETCKRPMHAGRFVQRLEGEVGEAEILAASVMLR